MPERVSIDGDRSACSGAVTGSPGTRYVLRTGLLSCTKSIADRRAPFAPELACSLQRVELVREAADWVNRQMRQLMGGAGDAVIHYSGGRRYLLQQAGLPVRCAGCRAKSDTVIA